MMLPLKSFRSFPAKELFHPSGWLAHLKIVLVGYSLTHGPKRLYVTNHLIMKTVLHPQVNRVFQYITDESPATINYDYLTPLVIQLIYLDFFTSFATW